MACTDDLFPRGLALIVSRNSHRFPAANADRTVSAALSAAQVSWGARRCVKHDWARWLALVLPVPPSPHPRFANR